MVQDKLFWWVLCCSQTVSNICLQVLTCLEQNLVMVLISFFLESREKVFPSENTFIFFLRTQCFVLPVLSSQGSAPTLLNMLAALNPSLYWSPDIVFEAPLGYFCSSLVALSLFCWKIQCIFSVLHSSSFFHLPFFCSVSFCSILGHCGNTLLTSSCNPQRFPQVCTVCFRLQMVCDNPKFLRMGFRFLLSPGCCSCLWLGVGSLEFSFLSDPLRAKPHPPSPGVVESLEQLNLHHYVQHKPF